MGVTVYPAWQFQRRDDRVVEVKPTLVRVFRTPQRFDGWVVAVLLHTPSPELDAMTPGERLKGRNEPRALVDLARIVARELAAGSVTQ